MKTSFAITALASLHAFASAASLVEVLTSANAATLLALVKSDPAVLTALSTFSGTLFAPTDAALAATVASGFNASDISALSNVLTYHAVAGTPFSGAGFSGTEFLTALQGNDVKVTGSAASGVQVFSAFGNPAATVMQSLPFDGGFVHVVDQTLIPPANVVAVAKAANLTSLVDAIVAAGLADTVSKLKNVTILAPTNEAFAAIASVAAGLSVAQLQQVLLYHVIPGVVHSTDIVKAKSLPAVATANNGTTLDIQFNGSNALITGKGNKGPATVALADVLADRVVVHVIDTVLLPPLGGAPATTTMGLLSKSGGFASSAGFAALAVVALFV
ncbi:Stabilin-2 [Podochytrium sp. JEL0797]|nr:Stabilin-2 [Podochytrium sp. JEL0797]